MNTLIHWLIATANQFAVGLMAWSWQALVLLVFVSLSVKICRAKTPSIRHQIWLFGLIAVALLPLATPMVQRFPAPQKMSPTLRSMIEAPRTLTNFAPRVTTQNLLSAAPIHVAAEPAAKATVNLSIVPPLLFAVWAIGVMSALIRLVKSYWRTRRVVRLAQSVRPASLDCAEFEDLMTGKVGLRLSTEVPSPILCGVYRHIILLPADIAEWTTPAERSAMIEHELAHVERCDPLINLFQSALEVILFFHPLVRYACRQLSLEREMACDDHVVGSGAAAEVYAEGILKVAERSIAPSRMHQLALFSAKQILERRIEMILSRDRVRVTARRWRYLIVPMGMIALVTWLLIPVTPISSAQGQSKSGGRAINFEVMENVKQIMTFYEDGKNNSPSTLQSKQNDSWLKPPPPPPPLPVSDRAEFFIKWDGGPGNTALKLLNEVPFAYMTRRTSFLKGILADDYYGIDQKGVVYNKTQQIDELKKLKTHYGMSYESYDNRLSVEGNLAVGNLYCAIYPDNGDPTEEYRFTVTLVKRWEQWKVLSIHVSQKQ